MQMMENGVLGPEGVERRGEELLGGARLPRRLGVRPQARLCSGGLTAGGRRGTKVEAEGRNGMDIRGFRGFRNVCSVFRVLGRPCLCCGASGAAAAGVGDTPATGAGGASVQPRTGPRQCGEQVECQRMQHVHMPLAGRRGHTLENLQEEEQSMWISMHGRSDIAWAFGWLQQMEAHGGRATRVSISCGKEHLGG
jgi:hypothetical protein